jgi:hypothetical protein
MGRGSRLHLEGGVDCGDVRNDSRSQSAVMSVRGVQRLQEFALFDKRLTHGVSLTKQTRPVERLWLVCKVTR